MHLEIVKKYIWEGEREHKGKNQFIIELHVLADTWVQIFTLDFSSGTSGQEPFLCCVFMLKSKTKDELVITF